MTRLRTLLNIKGVEADSVASGKNPYLNGFEVNNDKLLITQWGDQATFSLKNLPFLTEPVTYHPIHLHRVHDSRLVDHHWHPHDLDSGDHWVGWLLGSLAVGLSAVGLGAFLAQYQTNRPVYEYHHN